MNHLCHFAVKSVYLSVEHRVDKNDNGRTDGRTDGQVDKKTLSPCSQSRVAQLRLHSTSTAIRLQRQTEESNKNRDVLVVVRASFVQSLQHVDFKFSGFAIFVYVTYDLERVPTPVSKLTHIHSVHIKINQIKFNCFSSLYSYITKLHSDIQTISMWPWRLTSSLVTVASVSKFTLQPYGPRLYKCDCHHHHQNFRLQSNITWRNYIENVKTVVCISKN